MTDIFFRRSDRRGFKPFVQLIRAGSFIAPGAPFVRRSRAFVTAVVRSAAEWQTVRR